MVKVLLTLIWRRVIELVADELVILNASQPLPISLNESNQSSEDLRLKYRYLDLRRPKMQETLKQRAKYLSFIRRFMEDQDFLEVQTPILANSSPEGARFLDSESDSCR